MSAKLVQRIERLEGGLDAFPHFVLALWRQSDPGCVEIDGQSIAVPSGRDPHEFATAYVNARSTEKLAIAMVRAISSIDVRPHPDDGKAVGEPLQAFPLRSANE